MGPVKGVSRRTVYHKKKKDVRKMSRKRSFKKKKHAKKHEISMTKTNRALVDAAFYILVEKGGLSSGEIRSLTLSGKDDEVIVSFGDEKTRIPITETKSIITKSREVYDATAVTTSADSIVVGIVTVAIPTTVVTIRTSTNVAKSLLSFCLTDFLYSILWAL